LTRKLATACWFCLLVGKISKSYEISCGTEIPVYSAEMVKLCMPSLTLHCLSLSSQAVLYSAPVSASANSDGVAYTIAINLRVNFFGKGGA